MQARLALLAAAALLAFPAAVRAASVSVRPALAPPGATVSFEGAGLPRDAPVAIVAHHRAFARARTGADGTFQANVVLPRRLARGPQRFSTRSGHVTVENVVRVVPQPVDWAPLDLARSDGVRVAISRSVAFPTAPVRVVAYGIPPRAVVRAALREGPLALARADRRGRAALMLHVPGSLLDGSGLDLQLGGNRLPIPFFVLDPTTIAPPLPQPLRPDPIVGAAGDVSCRPDQSPAPFACRQQATADVLAAGQPDVVAMLGDGQYDRSAPEELLAYDATWGRLRDRTRPAIGNHEYLTDFATPYFDYFGAAAGDPLRGYYSYDLGAWHVVVLNANCGQVTCRQGGRQEAWLRADLAAHPRRCTLAYWHQPRFSSAQLTAENVSVQPLWDDLQAAGADVVLSGHVHNYERFAPQSPAGQFDPRGIREFVVGTGGRDLNPLRRLRPNSEAHTTDTFGALFLTLRRDSYDWRFVAAAGSDFSDAGIDRCH